MNPHNEGEMDATSERAREFIRYTGEHGRPPEDVDLAEYVDESVQVGERVVRLADLTAGDLRQWAREERARAYTDYTRPSDS